MSRLGRPLEMLCERGKDVKFWVFKLRVDEIIGVLLARS